MNAVKFHKQFGQVEVINNNGTMTTIVILATGEQKTLMNKFVVLSDVAFEAPKKAKAISRNLTSEEQAHIDYLNATNQGLASIMAKSKANYANGVSGLSSLTK